MSLGAPWMLLFCRWLRWPAGLWRVRGGCSVMRPAG